MRKNTPGERLEAPEAKRLEALEAKIETLVENEPFWLAMAALLHVFMRVDSRREAALKEQRGARP
jgi:hypothetical protein